MPPNPATANPRRRPRSMMRKREQETLDRLEQIARWIARGDKSRTEIVTRIISTWPLDKTDALGNQLFMTKREALTWFYRALDYLRSGHAEDIQEARQLYIRSLEMTAGELREKFEIQSVKKKLAPDANGDMKVVETTVQTVFNTGAVTAWIKIKKEVATVLGLRPQPGPRNVKLVQNNVNASGAPGAESMTAQSVDSMDSQTLARFLGGRVADVVADSPAGSTDAAAREPGDEPSVDESIDP